MKLPVEEKQNEKQNDVEPIRIFNSCHFCLPDLPLYHKQVAVTVQTDGVVCVGLQTFTAYHGELIEIL